MQSEHQFETDRFSIRVHASMEPLEEVWRQLETAPECAIHQTYDWSRIWVEETNCSPLFVVAHFKNGDEAGEPAFILPLTKEKLGPVHVAKYVSAPYNNLNFGVFSPAFLNSATPGLMAGLSQSLAAANLGVDLLILDRQPESWSGRKHPFAMLPRTENQNRAFQVTLNGGFEAVLALGNAKRRRKKFRTSERRLDELGGYRYVKAKTENEARELLDIFFAQKAARFEIHGLPDAFSAPQIKSFFRQLAAASLETSSTSLIEMHAIRLHDGTVCAISALSRKGSHVICQFSSIALGRSEAASPGELLFYLMIREACEEGAELFDFGIGDEQFKRSWCDVETVHYDTVIPTTLKGRFAAFAVRQLVHGKRIAKSNPTLFRAAKSVRYVFHRR